PIAAGQVIEESGVTLSIEHGAMPVVKPRSIKVHSAKDLLSIPLARSRNERLMAAPCPGLVEAGILAETGFVGEEQSRAAISGFFLAWDRCIAATDLGRPDRPWPICDEAAARRIPALEGSFVHVRRGSAP